MQKVTREQLLAKASELLTSGTVSCVLGWGKGEFDYDVTPTMFRSVEELNAGFVFNDFCSANFSKYLVSKAGKIDGRVLVFLKPCDTYSFNQLLTEHRFDREKVYAVGIPCEGMADISKIKAICKEGISAIDAEGEEFNPEWHNAVMHVEDDTVGEGVIVEEFQKGFKVGDRVIRHSVVKVAN